MIVPYVDLPAQHRSLKPRLIEALNRVLDHGQFILGPEVAELEKRLEDMLGVRHVIGVNSGTDALILALRLRGIGPGDEVITVSHSFVATASAIRLAGATPVFVDVEERTMLLDPALLDAALTSRTRAVMPVHLNGFPCDLDALEDFCTKHELSLIEDCAQSIGARFRGRPVGSIDLGCFSLHPLKVLSACGDAGFITAQRDDDAETLRRMRNIGLLDRDHCAMISGNSRLDTLQAAFLLVKLDYFEAWREARRAHARAYRAALEGKLKLPPEEAGHEGVDSAFVVRHPARDTIVKQLQHDGIDAKIHYPLAIHQQPPYRSDIRLPVTERVVAEIFSLPVIPEMTASQRDLVIDKLLGALRSETAAI